MKESKSPPPTPDICDAHPGVEVVDPVFAGFGGVDRFHGEAVTVACFEDNSRVREALSGTGNGRVLVVDAGGSMRCAMLGDNLARMGADHGWAGVIMYGCVRDVDEIAEIDIGVQAIGMHPRKSEKRGEGRVGEPVDIAGVTVRPGDWIYADNNGIVVAREQLEF